jgi:hypothetical protein
LLFLSNHPWAKMGAHFIPCHVHSSLNNINSSQLLCSLCLHHTL